MMYEWRFRCQGKQSFFWCTGDIFTLALSVIFKIHIIIVGFPSVALIIQGGVASSDVWKFMVAGIRYPRGCKDR